MENTEKNADKNTANGNPAEPDTLVKFNKHYEFEGKSYDEIDLHGLTRMTAEDMIAAEKYLNRAGVFSPIPEMTSEYVCFIASCASDQPIEFFKHLPPKETVKLRNKITSFFYGED